MRNILLIGISLVLLTAGNALAVKPDNPGGDKKDVINGLTGTINVYDGNNNRIGSLLLYSPSTNIYVLTDRDYAFSVSRFGGLISRNLYFSTSDCTGQAMRIRQRSITIISWLVVYMVFQSGQPSLANRCFTS